MNFNGEAFISGRFRGANHWEIHCNVLKAEACVPKVLSLGYIPFCPHKETENMQGVYPDQLFLDMCLAKIRMMNPERDILFMVENWRDSEGAREEYNLARELGITIMGEGDYEK